jgi:AcrR family transcriptional regulator
MTDQTSPARQKILDAASRVFAEEGFAGARVDEIARRAGVNKAMLYYHVGNKQALYTAVLSRNFDRMEEALDESFSARGSAQERLHSIIVAVSRVLQEIPDQPPIILREIASGGTNLQPEILERMTKLLALVGTLLADGVNSREFRGTDPVKTHLTLVGASLVLNAITPLRKRVAEINPEIGADDHQDPGAFLADLLLYGIAAAGTGE